jgi:hypothetical protein
VQTADIHIHHCRHCYGEDPYLSLKSGDAYFSIPEEGKRGRVTNKAKVIVNSNIDIVLLL